MTDAAPGSADTADLHAWQILTPLQVAGGYLPWTSGSMRPAAMVAVCNEIVHGARSRIVECGSGASTVLLARLLRGRGGGRLTAIEHDGHWAALVAEQLRREGLESIAQVLHAPLGGEPEWYSTAELGPVPGQVDLLIVDGPPACDPGTGTSRAPALPWFEERLVEGATVFLDDVDRPGEREVIAGWEAAGAWRFAIDAGTGLARGQRV
jgi:hypothetical protein